MICIEEQNLSAAWAKAFIKCYEHPGGVVSPISVSFSVDDALDIEQPRIRENIDGHLRSKDLSMVQTVSGTIFPQSLWKISGGDRNAFFRNYERILPMIQITRNNKKGIYFQRMMAFPGEEGKTVNQLKHIIETWNAGNHRHSAHQAAIFDPRTDHNHSRQLGFPCLHQVAFHADGSNGCDGLSIMAFYAKQLSFEKAYGNYLGLYHLGKFMANEMGLSLARVTCVTSALEMSKSSNLTKTEAGSMVENLKGEVGTDE